MRRGLSPTKAKEEASYRKERDEVRRSNPSVNYWKYFCHYNNAVYQGGMNAYKKHGKGLLLHDDGSAVVTEYMHDTICGHNIIFRENSIASLLYKNNTDCEIAYKVGKCIIKIPFSDSEKPHGLGLLIDYELYKVYELIFKKGVLVEKILHLDRRNNDDAFRNNTVAKLIGAKHESAFSLTFEKPQTIQVRYNNNQLIIGYHEHGEIKGLAFKMYAQNVDVWGKNGLYLKYIERGYYRHSLLQTFGEKYFSNGNKYIGQFLGGQFEGDGILLCPQEMKWMKGQFKDGKLTKVKDSNSKKYTQNNFHMWNKGLQQIHQKYRERYIDFDIQLPQQPFLYKILKQAVHMPVTQVEPDYQLSMKEDEYRMQRIQQQFLSGHPGDSNKSYVDQQLDKHYLVKTNKTIRPFESQRIKNKYYEDQAPKINNKTNKQPYFQERKEPTDRTQKIERSNNIKLTGSQYRDSEKHYQMKDPFEIQLIKVPYEQPERQVKPRERARLQQRQTKVIPKKQTYTRQTSPRRQTYARQQSKQSSRQRKKSPTTNFDSNTPYERLYSSPYEGLYSRNYLAELQRQRDWYRRLEREDAQYFNYLRGGIERSPQHRSYYRTPPKYESYPSRNNGKIINKKSFNYRQPTNESLLRYSPQRYSSQRFSSKESSLDKNSSMGVSRTSPYKYRR